MTTPKTSKWEIRLEEIGHPFSTAQAEMDKIKADRGPQGLAAI
jgi:hypothetical protein